MDENEILEQELTAEEPTTEEIPDTELPEETEPTPPPEPALYIVPQESGFGTSTFFGTNPPDGVIEISQEQLEALKNYDLCWQDGQLIEYTGEKPVRPTYEREEYAVDSPEDKEIIRLIRKRYTLSKELKIQRERELNPEQFAEFNSYVVDCIRQVKGEE